MAIGARGSAPSARWRAAPCRVGGCSSRLPPRAPRLRSRRPRRPAARATPGQRPRRRDRHLVALLVRAPRLTAGPCPRRSGHRDERPRPPAPRAGRRPPPRLVPRPASRLRRGSRGRRDAAPGPQVEAALARLCGALADLGIAAAPGRCAGLRRLDVAADLRTDSAAEGLALLECVGAASFGAGKLAAYRAERRTESVLVKTRADRTLARVYDKGAQRGGPPGRWLRFEAQWRFPRDERPVAERLDGAALRHRFKRRFEALWQAAGGISLADPLALAERIGAAVASGQLAPSRARSLAGYLLLSAAGMPQGARRTTCELERECRELGLAVVLDPGAGRWVDVAEALDQCADPGVWGAESA